MSEPGRRERKKARTREALADAALELFLARGFDEVGVKEVADAADVAVTTLFKHFPSKEALVFDREEEVEAGLVAAVRDRPAGTSIPEALRRHVLAGGAGVQVPGMAAFRRMVGESPSLRAYSERMWTRHEAALARVVADQVGAAPGDLTCAALARFALAAHALAAHHPDPGPATDAAFALLERGWDATRAAPAAGPGPASRES